MTTHPIDIHDYRAWLVTVHAQTVRALRAAPCPPELRVSLNDGMAAGLETARIGLDRFLAKTRYSSAGQGAPSLTRRQRETLALAANGNSNQQIADWLGVTPHSVDAILSRAYRALGANDRAQAVAIALVTGELDVHEIHVPKAHRDAA